MREFPDQPEGHATEQQCIERLRGVEERVNGELSILERRLLQLGSRGDDISGRIHGAMRDLIHMVLEARGIPEDRFLGLEDRSS